MKRLLFVLMLAMVSFVAKAYNPVKITNTSGCQVYFTLLAYDKNTCQPMATAGLYSLNSGVSTTMDLDDPTIWSGPLPPPSDICYGIQVCRDCTWGYTCAPPVGDPCCFPPMSNLPPTAPCCPTGATIQWTPSGGAGAPATVNIF